MSGLKSATFRVVAAAGAGLRTVAESRRRNRPFVPVENVERLMAASIVPAPAPSPSMITKVRPVRLNDGEVL